MEGFRFVSWFYPVAGNTHRLAAAWIVPNGGQRYLGFSLNEGGDGAAIIGASLF